MRASRTAATTRGSKTVSRVERKREERVARILDATADELGSKGLSRFSLEDVAERLDVTKGSLYHYFPSREELVMAGIETLARRIMVELNAAVEGSEESATVRLRRLLTRQLDVVVWDYPASIELFTLRDPADVEGKVKAVRAGHDALFRGLVDEGLASGEFHLTSTAASLECMYSSINMSPLWIERDNPTRARQQIQELIDTLLMLVGVVPA
ncbi:TetR/AcrR family transcriptional regulator [Nocardioides ginsengisoli]